MASKYAGLPDIDTSNPDVYETPDVPSSFSFSHDSDSDSDHGLSTSGSSSNLLNAAAAATATARQASLADEAIDKARLKPADARDLFNKRKQHGRAGTSNGAGSSRSSLLPESTTYSVRNAARLHQLSETAKRQLRHQHLLDDNGDPLFDEPETPTEKLRRLRYEAQELEAEIEAQEAQRKSLSSTAGQDRGDEAESSSSEYEQINDLPRRDDADKTKPPSSRRRRKKPQLDGNGELSPAVLLKQLKRLRGNLESVSISESASQAGDQNEDDARKDRQTQELLQRLSRMRTLGSQSKAKAGTSESLAQLQKPETADLSQLDTRLHLLEKYVGTSEADIDEARPLPPPLLSTLARLEHQLQLLAQPRHLETISRRVRTLVTDLERVHEARRKIGDTRPLNIALSSDITISTGQPGSLPLTTPSQASSSAIQGSVEASLPPDALQKIDGLFQILPRIEPLLPLAPHLLTRLRSLATLHQSSITFSQDLQDSQKAVISLKESEGFLKQLLEGLQESMVANQETMKSNLVGLEARIDQVLQRVNVL